MANPTNDNEPPNTQMTRKRRGKKSVVWEHFTIETVDAGCTKARCMKCDKSFAYISGTKLSGTSHLKRHIQLGICPGNRISEKNGQVSPCTPLPTVNGTHGVDILPRKRRKYTSKSTSLSLYHDRCAHGIAKMIIEHEYPLDIVECPAFLNCLKSLQPQFTVLSIDDIERDCVGLYQRERQYLLNVIDRIPGRVNLSLEMCSTDQSVGYAFITGQFVDEDWKLHRRILSVVLLPFPDSDSAFNHAVLSCISDWNLKNKVLAVTLDESFANKDVRSNLRDLLSFKNPLSFNGEFLIGSCFGRVLCELAQDCLGLLQETVKKVRDSVKYVVSMESCQQRFDDLKRQLQVPSSKSLVLDDQTRWNTTYYMLVAASELKEVFSCLDTYDPNYQITLTLFDWKQVETLCIYLKKLLEATKPLTGPTYPTANLFFQEAWNVQLALINATTDDDVSLTWSMRERYNRYWKDYFLVLSIAAVLDPRFKMNFIEFSFSRMYPGEGDHWIKTVNAGVHELYTHYVVDLLPTPTFLVDGKGSFLKSEESEEETSYLDMIVKTEDTENEIYLTTSDDVLDDYDIYISGITNNQNVRQEIDQYLEETVLPRMQEFDVLGWWKLNRKKYPTLSKMASDILCLPISTVFQDSVFDMTCKKMDRYRCSLRPSTVEALVCAKDWLQHGSSDYLQDYFRLSNSVVKSEL